MKFFHVFVFILALFPLYSTNEPGKFFYNIVEQVGSNAFSYTQAAKNLIVKLQDISAKYPDNIGIQYKY